MSKQLVHHRNIPILDNHSHNSAQNKYSSPDILISIPLSEIIPDPYQARHDFTNLDDLKNSIKLHGLLEPLIVIKGS